jgi:hypothetical protein
MTTNYKNCNCPACGSENTCKLSLIHKNGISSSFGTAFIGNRVGSFSSRNQTTLSKFTAPPLHPNFILAREILLVIFLLLIPVVGIIYFIYSIIKFPKKYKEHKRVYPQTMKIWEHGYMCLRCEQGFAMVDKEMVMF